MYHFIEHLENPTEFTSNSNKNTKEKNGKKSKQNIVCNSKQFGIIHFQEQIGKKIKY